MTEPEARAMTAQPDAAPIWTAFPYDRDLKAAVVSDGLHNVCEVFGKPEIALARAELIAASWATAAERDRLKVVNEGLVTALELAATRLDICAGRMRGCNDTSDHPLGPHELVDEVDEWASEARKP